MNENILEKNLNLISRYNPDLAKKILSHTNLSADYRLEEAQSADPILYKDNFPTEDPIDPLWAALEKFNALEHKKKGSITVLLGIGMGYVLREISKRSITKIILHEPDLDFLRISLEFVDLSAELEKGDVIITNTYDDIEKAFFRFYTLNYPVNISFSYYYMKNDPVYRKEFDRKVRDIYTIFHINHKNLHDKSLIWTSKIFDNLPYIVKSQDLHVLNNKFKYKTAVIISAGPSLDKNIEKLKPYRDKVIVFCVGTALKTVLKYGIIPDFVVTIETTMSTKIQLDVPEISNINVIAANFTCSEVFHLKAKRFYNFYGNKTPISNWLSEILDAPKKKYEEAGTVAITAFYSAKMLGCDKIIFIGQDLAYTDNKCYSSGSIYEKYEVKDSQNVVASDTEELKKTLKIDETEINNHIKNLEKNLTYVKSIDGGTVLTRADFQVFIKYFEQIASKFGSELTLINSSAGGAFLEGYEHIPLTEALEKYSGESINVDKILQSHNLTPKEIAKRKKIILNKLSEIIKNYHQLQNILNISAEDHISPYFKEIAKEVLIYKEYSKLYRIYFKSIEGKESLTDEEVNYIMEETDYFKNWEENLYKEIETLFEENLEDFKDNLRAIKNDYVKISDLLEKNPYLKNCYLSNILVINNMIKNFEDTDENLLSLSKELNHKILTFKTGANSYMERIYRLTSKF